MSENTRFAVAIVALVYFGPLMLLAPIDPMIATIYPIREEQEML